MQPRRIVVLGAGAIGAPVAALLWKTRAPNAPQVVAVARGPHGRAIRERGVRLLRPEGSDGGSPAYESDTTVALPVQSLDAMQDHAPLGPDDLVLLSVMGHHTAEAVAQIDPAVPIVSLQNGTAPLDLLATRGHPVVAGVVYVPAERREPGVVALSGHPVPGAFLFGGWNASGRIVAEAFGGELARWLIAAGFRAENLVDIAPWVRAKLLGNLAGIVVALSDDDGSGQLDRIVTAAQAEATAVFAAAGQTVHGPTQLAERIGPLTIRPVDGQPRVGGSTRHALHRADRNHGTTLETAMLHGPIVTLATEYAVDVPVNRALVALAEQAGREGWKAGAMAPDALAEAVGLTR